MSYADDIETITKTEMGYGGVEYTYEWDVNHETGYRFLRAIIYVKGNRKAIVEFMHGNMPWGRENAYMIPSENGVCGRTRSYKNRENAKAKAIEFVTTGK